ncbi:MAG TPA: peroxiredoxin [Candidatus Binataceae bacterium]|nr:peroxiredoxin [Candidatus Binataceae bacterium]
MLKAGEDAPDFTLMTHHGKPLSLSSLRGKKVLLWFYPQAGTPGCTAEGCSLRDNFNYYEENNIAVLGVSFDPIEDNAAFAAKHAFPFILLSDTAREVGLAYGACDSPKAAYAERISYVIDEQGKIMRLYPQVDTRVHAAEVLADLLSE